MRKAKTEKSSLWELSREKGGSWKPFITEHRGRPFLSCDAEQISVSIAVIPALRDRIYENPK